ncbi:hypothetical protein [Streptomyces sp. R41]|uniref:Uncharacterized protein n=1 Tax=Streptomyces sp. R41 TaxID=3238632 RepID=A0AB39RTM0_9ACTN
MRRRKSINLLDVDSVAALPGLDVPMSGFQPGNAAKDIADTVTRSIADPTVYATAARSLLKALEGHPRTRLHRSAHGAPPAWTPPGPADHVRPGCPGVLHHFGPARRDRQLHHAIRFARGRANVLCILQPALVRRLSARTITVGRGMLSRYAGREFTDLEGDEAGVRHLDAGRGGGILHRAVRRA